MIKYKNKWNLLKKIIKMNKLVLFLVSVWGDDGIFCNSVF